MDYRLFRLLIALQKMEAAAEMRVALLRRAGIRIGRDSSLGSGVSLTTARLALGDNVRIGAGSRLNNAAMIDVHDWVRMGSEVLIETSSHRLLKSGPYRRCFADEVLKPVVIERGCMIFARATILPGVTLREGCVVGAGTTIDRSTVPNGLYVGNRPREPVHVFPASEDEPVFDLGGRVFGMAPQGLVLAP